LPAADVSDSPFVIAKAKAALVAVGVLPNPAKQYLVKRVVGVAGDRVICCTNTGTITVNGQEMNEPYVFDGNVPSDMNFDVTVPKGKLWVMGDHRGASADSRYHQDDINKGFVPLNRVTGRVLAVIWPIKNISLVPNVDALNQPPVKTKTK
jgi:signal peptidase I